MHDPIYKIKVKEEGRTDVSFSVKSFLKDWLKSVEELVEEQSDGYVVNLDILMSEIVDIENFQLSQYIDRPTEVKIIIENGPTYWVFRNCHIRDVILYTPNFVINNKSVVIDFEFQKLVKLTINENEEKVKGDDYGQPA